MSTGVAKDDVRPLRATPNYFSHALWSDAEAQPYPAEGMPEGWNQILVCRKREGRRRVDKIRISPKKSYKFNAEVKVSRFLSILDQVRADEVVETVCI